MFIKKQYSKLVKSMTCVFNNVEKEQQDEKEVCEIIDNTTLKSIVMMGLDKIRCYFSRF
jgi:hypothetical protein